MKVYVTKQKIIDIKQCLFTTSEFIVVHKPITKSFNTYLKGKKRKFLKLDSENI